MRSRDLSLPFSAMSAKQEYVLPKIDTGTQYNNGIFGPETALIRKQ